MWCGLVVRPCTRPEFFPYHSLPLIWLKIMRSLNMLCLLQHRARNQWLVGKYCFSLASFLSGPQVLRASVMCDNRSSPLRLCATIFVIDVKPSYDSLLALAPPASD